MEIEIVKDDEIKGYIVYLLLNKERTTSYRFKKSKLIDVLRTLNIMYGDNINIINIDKLEYVDLNEII